MSDNNASLAADLLWGAEAIALDLFGTDDPKAVRKTYYLLERGRIDAEKVGDLWVGSRSRNRRRFQGGA